MDLIRTNLRLKFAEPLHPWLEMRGLVRVAGDNSSIELEGSPVVIDVQKKKQRAILQFRAFTLIQEDVTSVDDSIASALDMVTDLDSASTLPSIVQIWHDSIFIEPYALPFHELVVLMKDQYLRPSPVVDSATDVGLVFDQHEGDIVKHIQIGPMERGQLRSMFLTWPRDGLPEQFAFASLGYEQNREILFHRAQLQEFLEAATKWQAEQAKIVFNYLQKKGG
jgi:hypothetical protein